MRTRLRHVAQINPLSRRFDRLGNADLVPFLPMENVWPGEKLDLSQLRPKSDVAVGYTRFQSGDIVVPKITPTFEASRSVLVPDLPDSVGVGTTELHVIRPGSLIEPRYLLYIFNSHSFLRLGTAEMYGVAGQKRIPDDFIRNWEVDLPSIEEQRRIADFLDAETASINKIQATTDEQLSLLRSLRIEAFRTMTTGTLDKKTTSITEIPWMPSISADWQLFKVGLCFRTGSGTTPRSTDDRFFNGPISWINTSDLRDGPISETAKTVSDLALKEYPTLNVYPVGTLMVAMYGATIGRVGINEIPACVNQACCALEPLGLIDVTYAFYWFLAHRAEILRLGTGGGQPNISQDLVRSLRIPAPNLMQTQQDIAAECRIVDEEVKNRRMMLLRRIDLLSERRQGLITAAVMGQIDVTTAGGLASAGGAA